MRSFTSSLALGGLISLIALAGCPNRAVTEVDPNQQPQERKLIPVTINRNVDILFVIDNSISMGGEQDSLAANFPAFMDVLNNIEGGLPNVHVGIVSSDVGAGGFSQACSTNDRGTLQNTARGGCTSGLDNGARYISDICPDGQMCPPTARQRNYSGDLAATFSCIARLGTNGCGLEQHLESMKQALDGSNAANANFLRPEAFLAVVFIADEDDCSAANGEIFNPDNGSFGPLDSFRCSEYGVECDEGTLDRGTPRNYNNCRPRNDAQYIQHPDVYVDFLKSLKPNDPQRLIVAGIIGNPEPVATDFRTTREGEQRMDLKRSCFAPGADPNDENAGARPGVRLKYFLEQFPNRNTFTSICDTNLQSALVKIAELLANVVGNPCLDDAVDVTDISPATGLQLDCAVYDVANPNTESEQSTPIPRCPMMNDTTPDPSSPQPCWYTYADAAACGSGTAGVTIKFLPEKREAADGTYTFVDCVAKEAGE